MSTLGLNDPKGPHFNVAATLIEQMRQGILHPTTDLEELQEV